MKTVATRSSLHLALTAALLGAAAAQQPGDATQHKRPEVGDAVPDVRVTLAATGAPLTLHAALAEPDRAGPLVLAFVHRDKDLCVRFLDELAEQVATLGPAKERCSILLVFCGEERDGAAIARAQQLAAPFRVCWDSDRSAYQSMGMIAFPTVYVVDREKRAIELLRRGYVITLAREVAGRLKVGLGLITREELDRIDNVALGPTAAIKRHTTRLQQAWQLLRSGKADEALQQFEAMLGEDAHDPAAQSGRAVAAWRLHRADALELLQAAHRELPDDTAIALALGEALLAAGRADDAEPLLRMALDREGPRAWFALGSLHEQRGAWREAAAAYREAAQRLLR